MVVIDKATELAENMTNIYSSGVAAGFSKETLARIVSCCPLYRFGYALKQPNLILPRNTKQLRNLFQEAKTKQLGLMAQLHLVWGLIRCILMLRAVEAEMLHDRSKSLKLRVLIGLLGFRL